MPSDLLNHREVADLLSYPSVPARLLHTPRKVLQAAVEGKDGWKDCGVSGSEGPLHDLSKQAIFSGEQRGDEFRSSKGKVTRSGADAGKVSSTSAGAVSSLLTPPSGCGRMDAT